MAILSVLVTVVGLVGLLALERTGSLVPDIVGGTIQLEDGRTLSLDSAEEVKQALERYSGHIVSAQLTNDSAVVIRLVVMLTWINLIVVLVYVLVRERHNLYSWFKPDLRTVLIGLIGGLLLSGFGAAYGALLEAIDLSPLQMGPIEQFWKLLTSSPMGLFLVVVLAPLTEEAYFRGRLYGKVSAEWGVRAAMYITATAFAVAHLLPMLLPAYLVYGLALAALRRRTDGLVAPTIAHVTNNGVATFLLAHFH